MGFHKGHHEFHTLDMKDGWHHVPGYPPGFSEKILAGDLDVDNKRGNRTRILRIEPGAFSTVPFVHDYWEEVYLLEGDLIVGDPLSETTSYGPHTYACRPPGAFHGPFRSTAGCLLLEVHYY